MEELWRPVPGYEAYEVSNLGNIRSYRSRGQKSLLREKPVPLRPTPLKSGHAHVGLHRDGVRKTRYIYHLVLEAFVGPRPCGMEACHNNGNAADNRLENLRWDTPKANNADKWQHGTQAFGERQPLAKLTASKVRAARELYATGQYSYQALADRFGVSMSGIWKAIKGQTWSHLA